MRGLSCAFCLAFLSFVVATEAFAADVVPGEFMVLFKSRDVVTALEGRDRDIAVSVMLDFQAEYLTVRYDVEVRNSFSAISCSSGKGMFLIRSEKAGLDKKFGAELLKDMKADPFIEAVSPNEVKNMIPAPVDMSKKRI